MSASVISRSPPVASFGQLERIERDARVPVRHRDEPSSASCESRAFRQTASRIGEARRTIVRTSSSVTAGARRRATATGARVDLERRVLRRRAEEDHVAVLDVREHDILLGLVEAMDLVDEQDRALVGEPAKLARSPR
jgi:hypothetical protein